MSRKTYNPAGVLTYPREFYNPYDLKSIPDQSVVKQEYQRLRKIARTRLRRLEQAGFSSTETYQRNVNRYPQASKLTEYQMRLQLTDLANFISAKSSTVTGAREIRSDTIKSLQELYPGIDETNIDLFGRVMEKLRQVTGAKSRVYSGRIARLFSAKVPGRSKKSTFQSLLREYEEDEGFPLFDKGEEKIVKKVLRGMLK